jgi:hypothetical protein
MSDKKTFNVIIGAALILVGVLLILCGAIPTIIDILLGVACLVASIAIVVKTLITKKRILVLPNIFAAIILAIGITLFIAEGMFGSIILTILNFSLITVGAVMLADTIYHFVKKRNLAINIVEIVIAVALIVVGIIAVIPDMGAGALVFYFAGSIITLGGIVVVIASLIDFKKYQQVESKPAPKAVSSKSTKKKRK